MTAANRKSITARSRLAIVAALLLSTSAAASAGDDAAAIIHRRTLVLDSHADVLIPSTSKRYFLADGGSRIDLAHLIAGGVDAIVLAAAVGSGPEDAAGFAAARKEVDTKLATIKAFIADNPKNVGLATTADDVERLHREGRVAVLIGFQNARSIGREISQFDIFYREGVRIFAFAHAGHNELADSSRPRDEPEQRHGGLSPLGKQAVTRLNDLGALIDVSQLSTNALLQTVELSRTPVVASHSSARALIDNSRNLSDAELDAIKAKGGVVQVTPFSAYLHRQSADTQPKINAIRAAYGLAPTTNAPSDGYTLLPKDQRDKFLDELSPVLSRGTLSEFVDHIDYVAKRIGWQHVGIGSDFNHGGGVIGYDSAAEAPAVTREFVRRGYTAEQIKAIWGGNFLRILKIAQQSRRG